jgi:long-chain acyl-CoA synthetase
MSLTFEEAIARLTVAGSPFEITDANVLGKTQPVFKNFPAIVPHLFVPARATGATADRPFLVYEGESISFAEAFAIADALGHALVNTYGVVKGDRVGIAMRNYPEWVISYIAIVSVGAISVSFNSWWTADELAYGIEDSTPKVLIVDRERLASTYDAARKHDAAIIAVRTDGALPAGVSAWVDVATPGPDGPAMPEVSIDPDDDASILYTSGTTGHPKGAVSTHRAVTSALGLFALRSTAEGLRNPPPPPAVGEAPVVPSFILIVPLFHVTGGVAVMLSCIASSLKLVIMYKWDVEKALQLIEREQITNFVGVPAQGWDLVNFEGFAKYDTTSLRSIGGGGAPAPAAQVEKTAKAFPKGAPGIGYGMTETNAYGPQNQGADYVSHPTSAGKWAPPFQVVIKDEMGNELPRGERGEICFKGPNLIRGYWNKPEATASVLVDGWLHSGDVGRIDADGFIYVEDRLKDMILRGGENVYCAEVESTIYEHPSVHEAAVFGMPHERLGEEVAVAVLAKDGETIDPAELQKFIATKLAAFKVPSHVFIVSEPLPRNAAGKFLKRELRDTFVK